MSANLLTSEMLVQIRKYVCEDGDLPQDKWVTGLPLLGVSQRWRQTLAPMAYSNVYIDCEYTRRALQIIRMIMGVDNNNGDNNHDDDDDDDIQVENKFPNPEYEGNLSWRTNLSLLEASHVRYPINTMYLHIIDCTEAGYLVLNVANMIKAHSLYNYNIQTLNFSFEQTICTNFSNNFNKASTTNEFYIAQSLASNLPNITSLNFNGFTRSVNMLTLRDCLSIIYAPQLQKLIYHNCLSDLSPQVYFQQLASLEFELNDGYGFQLSKIFAGTLQYLKITHVSPAFPWFQFCDFIDQPQLVYFASLKKLDIHYINKENAKSIITATSNYIDPASYYQFCFPVLQILYIQNCFYDYSLFSRSNFPPHLHHVVVEGDLAVAGWLATSGVQHTDRLDIVLGSVANLECVDSLSSLYGNYQKYSTLTINDIPYTSLQQVDWTYLHELTLYPFNDLALLVDLLKHMNNLRCFHFKNTPKSHIFYDPLIQQHLNAPNGICQQKLSIQRLSIACPNIIENTNRAIELALFFTTISPNLRDISIGLLPNELLNELFEECQQQYPYAQKAGFWANSLTL
ncbi:hypothetical protein BX667DRAFT_505407 [Coemansia mojavensis]|nr:hypothetical protein BX667DRAFT_505407 [Coemansia mojavensis]